MDHIAEKGYVWRCHYGVVHKPVSIQEATKMPEDQAAADEQWEH